MRKEQCGDCVARQFVNLLRIQCQIDQYEGNVQHNHHHVHRRVDSLHCQAAAGKAVHEQARVAHGTYVWHQVGHQAGILARLH